MRKFSSLLAGVVAISALAAAAQADFIVTGTRTTQTIAAQSGFTYVNGTVGQQVDVISFQIKNDGLNGTGTTLNGVNLTAVTTNGAAFIFRNKGGTSGGVDVSASMGVDVADFPGPIFQNANAFGNALTSFIRFSAFDGSIATSDNSASYPVSGGTATNFQLLYSDANGTTIAQPGGTYPENRNRPSAAVGTYDPINGTEPNYNGLNSFNVQGGFSSTGQSPNAQNFIPLATLVVPVGTGVTLTGFGGGNTSADPSHPSTPIFGQNIVGVPEPASLGLLALGGLALLARRRKD